MARWSKKRMEEKEGSYSSRLHAKKRSQISVLKKTPEFSPGTKYRRQRLFIFPSSFFLFSFTAAAGFVRSAV